MKYETVLYRVGVFSTPEDTKVHVKKLSAHKTANGYVVYGSSQRIKDEYLEHPISNTIDSSDWKSWFMFCKEEKDIADCIQVLVTKIFEITQKQLDDLQQLFSHVSGSMLSTSEVVSKIKIEDSTEEAIKSVVNSFKLTEDML